jgi:hypothetical protein
MDLDHVRPQLYDLTATTDCAVFDQLLRESPPRFVHDTIADQIAELIEVRDPVHLRKSFSASWRLDCRIGPSHRLIDGILGQWLPHDDKLTAQDLANRRCGASCVMREFPVNLPTSPASKRQAIATYLTRRNLCTRSPLNTSPV